jgi:protein arginine N-methyltransferase 1
LVVSRNESINGTLSLAPNARNHRDLDFVLSYTHKGKIEGTKSDTREYKMR